jgi:sn1-specific diacylglycerol lipase
MDEAKLSWSSEVCPSFLTPLSTVDSQRSKGTMSVNEIAADLTCEPEEFEPATTVCASSSDPDLDILPASASSVPFPSLSQSSHPSTSQSPIMSPLLAHSRTITPLYYVHGGMLRMARAMGDKGKPVQLAVKEALLNNPGYGMLGGLVF